MSLKGTQTEQNLLKAFAGESQARNRYEFFAKAAKKKAMSKSLPFSRKQLIRKRNMQRDSLSFSRVV
jgi:rubrerythrin